MKKLTQKAAFLTAAVLLFGAVTVPNTLSGSTADAASASIEDQMEVGTINIGGGGFVSGIVTGQKEMYLRTDVGGAYKYNYDEQKWEQLFDFINEDDRGFLSVKGVAIDPTDDNTAYFLCGCAYFSDARTAIFKTTDGGETFTEYDVTDLIQVHGNGDGRECIEPIAVDPDNPDTIYAGGDVYAGTSALIKSTDGGETWEAVDGYADAMPYPYTVKWPNWTDHQVKAITTSSEQGYAQQNGIGCILIEDGKVYVGTSVKGETNIHVANVSDDKFAPLSNDLPTENYPCSITSDHNGNIFFTYIAGLAFSGSAGGAYKYNTASGTVTDISPSGSAIGVITADKTDPDKLLARTCGIWSDQWYEEEWTEGSIAWGDYFYRSTDGGATWENITPGQGETIYDENGSHKVFTSNPIDTNGYDWVYGKACHWGSGILIDPRNPDKIWMTSGNGVFACDNAWDETGVQFYFNPKGVEEVVALDMVSVPGGNVYSAIGDYDGYIHSDVNEIGIQYTPNMGSTNAIAYCPQNPDVMIRCSENESTSYYTLDGGSTWIETSSAAGGKAAITQLEDGGYRFFKSSSDSTSVSYSDDYGASWNTCTGFETAYGSKPTFMQVEPNDPSIVYAYATYYNSSWYYSKSAPDISDAAYQLYVSTDYGATFTKMADVCMYDQCDSAGRIAYLGEGELVLGAGWYGAYHVTDYGKTIEKLDSVYYCKTIGYGAPEEEGGINTLYMYGQPDSSDPQGIYRSTDGGETWVLINKDHLYGGTGNGNFLVGDMNEFGTVYMSTVGGGIVYMSLSSGTNPNPDKTTTTTAATTTSTAITTTVSSESTTGETTASSNTTAITSGNTETTAIETTVTTTVSDEMNVLYGDTNLDNQVTLVDLVYLNKNFAGNGVTFNAQQKANADCFYDGIINASDATSLLKFLGEKISALPEQGSNV